MSTSPAALSVSTILDRIIAVKRDEVAAAKAKTPEGVLREKLADAPQRWFVELQH